MQVFFVESAPVQTEGAFVIRQGLFFRCGEYPDREFHLTEEEADAAIAAFTPVNNNVEHYPTLFDGRLGTVRRLWREGVDILAEYCIPRWFHEVTQGEPLRTSAEWNRTTKRVLGNAFVLHPRIADAAMMAAFHCLSPEARVRAGKETTMSLRERIQALFTRAGVPAEVVESELKGEDFVPGLSEADRAAFADLKARSEAQAQEIAAMREQSAQGSRQAQCALDSAAIDSLVNDFRLTPAEAERYRTLAQENPAAFAATLPILRERSQIAALVGFGDTVSAADVEREMFGNPDAGAEIIKRTHAKVEAGKGQLPFN